MGISPFSSYLMSCAWGRLPKCMYRNSLLHFDVAVLTNKSAVKASVRYSMTDRLLILSALLSKDDCFVEHELLSHD